MRKVDYEFVIWTARSVFTRANLTLRASRAIKQDERPDDHKYLTGLWQIGIRWGPAHIMWNTDLSVQSVSNCIAQISADLRNARPTGIRNGRRFYYRSNTPFRFLTRVSAQKPHTFQAADHIKTFQSRGWDYWEETFRQRLKENHARRPGPNGGYRRRDFWLEYP